MLPTSCIHDIICKYKGILSWGYMGILCRVGDSCAAKSTHPGDHLQAADYLTIKLMILPGTKISLTMVLPVTCRAICSTFMAEAATCC